MEERIVTWLRAGATQRDQSLSCFLGALLREQMRESSGYETAMRRFWTAQPRNLSDGQAYPSRDEIYKRKTLR